MESHSGRLRQCLQDSAHGKTERQLQTLSHKIRNYDRKKFNSTALRITINDKENRGFATSKTNGGLQGNSPAEAEGRWMCLILFPNSNLIPPLKS